MTLKNFRSPWSHAVAIGSMFLLAACGDDSSSSMGTEPADDSSSSSIAAETSDGEGSSSSVIQSSSSVIRSDNDVDRSSSSSVSLSSESHDIRDCATCCASGVIPCGEESSSSVNTAISSSSVILSSSSTVLLCSSSVTLNDSEELSSSSSVEQNSSAALVENGWSWNVPKETRLNSDITYGTITDDRDGQTYKTVTIGNQVWMAENLNYADSTKTPSLLRRSWCYDNDNANCAVTGRLYTWAAAIDSVALYDDGNGKSCGYRNACKLPEKMRGICPKGWHLPTNTDWNTLFDEVGGKSVAGKILKSRTGWNYSGNGTDAYGFSVLPAGNRSYKCDYYHVGKRALFWSVTQFLENNAYIVILYYSLDEAYMEDESKDNAFSVRCLKN